MARPTGSRRLTVWTALVPVVALAAGMLFATSGQTALGTDLRAGESSQLTSLIDQRDSTVARQQRELAELQRQVQALTDQAGSRNAEVAAVQAAGESGVTSAGLTALAGSGLRIVLDDAPVDPDGVLPGDATVDDVVIHQADVQAVVNALWAAGADGVAIMGERMIATSAVICVGSTLLLQGRRYSPPFVITAVGDSGQMRQQLSAAPGVQQLELAVDDYGLTYTVEDQRTVELPAYDGALDLRYASTAG